MERATRRIVYCTLAKGICEKMIDEQKFYFAQTCVSFFKKHKILEAESCQKPISHFVTLKSSGICRFAVCTVGSFKVFAIMSVQSVLIVLASFDDSFS